jgi:integrase
VLLILTGCRLGEIMTLKWEYVDLAVGVLNLPDSKTGAKPSISASRPSTHYAGSLASPAIHG